MHQDPFYVLRRIRDQFYKMFLYQIQLIQSISFSWRSQVSYIYIYFLSYSIYQELGQEFRLNSGTAGLNS